MRILIINSEFSPIGGGAGNASAHIARQFAMMEHQVMVVTAHFGDLSHIEQDGNLIIHRISTLRRRQDRSNALEQIAFILSASIRTLDLIPHFKPHVTLAFFGIPSGMVSWFIRKIYKIPYVVSLRGGDVPGFRPYDFKTHHKLLAPLIRMVWMNAFAIVANSNGLRDLALKFDSRFEIPIIPNGVDVESTSNENRDWESPHLLSVGRLVYQKGLDLAMHALTELKDVQWQWDIVGDGPQMDALQSLASELGIADRITFTGWQSREQLMRQYKQANLFLFPSRHEGMPNAVLEAMAGGLPVIASCIAGNEELVVDHETGLLFPSEDVDALREALRKLLNDSALRQKMGAASRRRVEKHYSWESTAKQYALLLEQVQ